MICESTLHEGGPGKWDTILWVHVFLTLWFQLAPIQISLKSFCKLSKILYVLSEMPPSWVPTRAVVLNVRTTAAAAHQRWKWKFWRPTIHPLKFFWSFYTFIGVKMNLFGCFFYGFVADNSWVLDSKQDLKSLAAHQLRNTALEGFQHE